MSYTLITVARCTCDRPQCGRSFTARDDKPPTRCPYCGSKKWDVKGLQTPIFTHKGLPHETMIREMIERPRKTEPDGPAKESKNELTVVPMDEL